MNIIENRIPPLKKAARRMLLSELGRGFTCRSCSADLLSFRSGVRSDSRGSPLCGRSRLHPRLSLACGFHLLTLRSCAPPQGSLVFFRRRS